MPARWRETRLGYVGFPRATVSLCAAPKSPSKLDGLTLDFTKLAMTSAVELKT